MNDTHTKSLALARTFVGRTLDYVPTGEIGLRIARRRKEIQIKQEELARMVKYSRGQIANVESGRAVPSLALLYRIAYVLGDTSPKRYLP